ncbi:MAG: cation:proton antiporter [Chloroflexi bacterium]|nr:cation:proton antiporter [Chloroflexota bacterium]
MEHSGLLLSLAAILLGAKLAEGLSRRLGLPPVLGEVIFGVLVGPSVLHWVAPSEPITLLGNLGVVLLLFVAGLETRPAELREVGRAALLTAVGGVALPFALGYGVGRWLGLETLPSLFVGTILTATSVSISAETLRSMGRLRTRAGTTVMGAAIVDDVLGLLILAAVAATGQSGGLLFPLARVAGFAVVGVAVGLWILPHLMHLAHIHLSREALLALVVAVVLAYAWSVEELGGLAAITGAYLAGLLLGRTRFREQAAEGAQTLGYGLLVPIFLVWVGMQADVRALAVAPRVALAVTGVAVAGQLIGCYAGARVQLSHRESLWVGTAMISRGEVALVVAAAGRAAGLVDERIFSAAVAMTLVTTVITPLALRLLLPFTTRGVPDTSHALGSPDGSGVPPAMARPASVVTASGAA